MIEILPTENDDKNLVRLVEQIFNAGVRLNQPNEVFIVKVDHWFDWKWREFSHKVFGALGIWRNPLRIPPFIPDRIIEERHFERVGKTYRQKDGFKLHIYQHSDENVQRKIKRTSAIYVWYSGDTMNNSQASLMVYTFNGEFQNSWYVSFTKKSSWQIYKTDNISKAEVKLMIENNYLALTR